MNSAARKIRVAVFARPAASILRRHRTGTFFRSLSTLFDQDARDVAVGHGRQREDDFPRAFSAVLLGQNFAPLP